MQTLGQKWVVFYFLLSKDHCKEADITCRFLQTAYDNFLTLIKEDAEARRAMVRFEFKDKGLGEKPVEHGESKDLLSENFNKIKAKKKMPKGPAILTHFFWVTVPPDFLVGRHGSSLYSVYCCPLNSKFIFN